MNFYLLWMKRSLFSIRTVFQFSTMFSLFGLILSVACLTLVVLVVEGFSSALENSMVNRQGHLRVMANRPQPTQQILQDMAPYKDKILKQMPFAEFEGLIIKGDQFKGVFFEALEDKDLKNSSFLKSRILKGKLNHPGLFIILGMGLAEELKITPKDTIKVVVPALDNSHSFIRSAQVKAVAIADFGRHEFNSYLSIAPLSLTKKLGMKGVSGLNIWLKQKSKTDSLKQKIQNDFKGFYSVSSWKDKDRAFFQVIESDKKIIFFVLFVLIAAAGFNVSGSLFVQVFRKTKDITILKALGASNKTIRNIFLLKGLFLGCVGTTTGVFFGFCLSRVLVLAQNKWQIIPESIYKVNTLSFQWQSADILLLWVATVVVALFSSVWPAKRALKMNITKGLSF